MSGSETGIWSDEKYMHVYPINGIFYGAGGFNGLSKEHKKAEIGFWLLPDFWKKGYMQEAFPVICNYGFEKLDLNRIEGFVDSENANCKNGGVLHVIFFTKFKH